MAVLIDIAQLEAVAVDHVLAEQVMGDPGVAPAFELWNPADLGYLAAYAAVNYASGKINGTQGQTFTAGKLGKFTIGTDHSVLLGPPFVFTKSNINNFNF